jgi:hypothetical protein
LIQEIQDTFETEMADPAEPSSKIHTYR